MTRGFVPGATWRTGGSIEHVKRVGSTSHKVESRELHDAAYSSFRDAVQLMNVRWASCCMHAKFSCAVAVDGTHNTCGCVTAGVEQSSEARQKLSHVSGCFVLVAKCVHGLKAGVVVHDDERVAASPVHGWEKRSCEVDVDQSTRVRRRVEVTRMRQARRVGFGTGGA
eukprot:3819319-Pleurochrysis_carterae.AAC.1